MSLEVRCWIGEWQQHANSLLSHTNLPCSLPHYYFVIVFYMADRLDGRSSTVLQQSGGSTRVVQGQWDYSPDLTFESKSSTVCCVEDLCSSLDTGENPRGGAHGAVARGNIDLIFGFVESHVQGGKQIKLPLKNHGNYVLDRITDTVYGSGNIPKFERTKEEMELAAEVGALGEVEVAAELARL